MLANAALFAFGAVEHEEVEVRPFSESRIMPAVIVETVCALALGGEPWDRGGLR